MKEDILLYTGAGPTSRFLDVGCGSGRMARHFVDYVEPPGRYVGLDVVKPFIEWCETHISAASPVFEFYHQDVYNGLYNPEGRHKASEYRFPFEDESFDVVFLASVFTHMLPEDIENYLREIRRLLKPEGTCFSTWLLLGHDAGVRYTGVQTAEGQVRYGFMYLLDMLERAGLTLAREPVPKRWAGDDQNPFRMQDLVLLRRSRPEDDAARERRRYTAPETPSASPDDLEEARGTVRFFDPVLNAVTLLVGEGTQTFRIAGDADVRANGKPADTSALREGQWSSVRFAAMIGDGSAGGQKVAAKVEVADQPTEDSAAGIIETIDLRRGLVTIRADRKHLTFEFDPKRSRVRVNREAAEPGELREGQRANVRYSLEAVSINARDVGTDV